MPPANPLADLGAHLKAVLRALDESATTLDDLMSTLRADIDAAQHVTRAAVPIRPPRRPLPHAHQRRARSAQPAVVH